MDISGDVDKEEMDKPTLWPNKKVHIKRRFIVACMAVVLVFSGFSSTLLLQSSINIVDGLGTKATAVGYITSMLFCLLVTPFLLRLVGVKKALLASEFAYLIYVICNLYPNPYVLIVAGLVVGFAESLFWFPLSAIFNYFGKIYSRHSNKPEEVCVGEFSGIIFGLLPFNMVFGNLFVFGILRFMNPGEIPPLTNNVTQPLTTRNYTGTFPPDYSGLSLCGVNDCQDPSVTILNIDRYVPVNRTPIFVLLATFIVIMVTGILLHFIFLPEMPLDYGKVNRTESWAKEEVKHPNEEDDVILEESTEEGNRMVVEFRNKCNMPQTIRTVSSSLKDTFLQIVKVDQLLLMPTSIYFGHQNGFVFSDATRAFASCTMGVSQVGLCIITFAIVSALSSYLSGKLLTKFGYLSLFVLALIADLVGYTTALVWQPSSDTTWLVFVIFALLGLSSGSWQIIIANLYTQLFYSNREVSFTIANLGYSIGFSIQYAWSTSLCVREKLFVLIGFLIFCQILLVILCSRHRWFKISSTAK